MPRKNSKKKKWFKSEIHSGWSKSLSANERRELVLESHDGDYLSAARSKQALANLTKDRDTKKKAQADADYFYLLYRKYR